MKLKDILLFRRAVRFFDPQRPLEDEAVKSCIELAQLAPTSSNMQLWEAYHVTDKETLTRLGKASLAQSTATTAQQMVIFITRPTLHKKHAKQILEFERDNIHRNSPEDRWEHRIKNNEQYYGKMMPFLYSRCWGLLGVFRKILMTCAGWFQPVVHEVSESDMRVVLHKSCALAAQTFMLAMAEQGMDTCPMEGFDSKRVKRILHLPSDAEVSIIVTCGYRSDNGVFGDRFRLPFEEIYRKV